MDSDDTFDEFRQAHTDIHETEKEFRVSVELPGVDQHELQMDISPERLEIRVDKGDNKWFTSIALPSDANIGAMQTSHVGTTFEFFIPRTGAA